MDTDRSPGLLAINVHEAGQDALQRRSAEEIDLGRPSLKPRSGRTDGHNLIFFEAHDMVSLRSCGQLTRGHESKKGATSDPAQMERGEGRSFGGSTDGL
jgi:hypothetical protein